MKIGNWGGRAQLRETVSALEDLKGNRDGLHGNEDLPAGEVAAAFERQTLVKHAKDLIDAGFSSRDEVATLQAFVTDVEAKSGPVMDPAIKSRLQSGDLFAAQKAIHCLRMERDPGSVDDMLLPAAGTVNGRAIDAGQVFAQHFPPTTTPTGNVVVVSPGFGMTGRDFYEQAQLLNAQGHDVIVFDHQWAGQSSGKKGGIESGESVALATATVLAEAEKIRAERYGDTGKVALMAVSMGGGVGGLGALLLADNGRLSLDSGASIPKNIDAVLDGPFFGATPSLLNHAFAGLSEIPMVNRIRAPWLGLPDLTDVPVAEQKQAQSAVMEDVRAQTSAFSASEPFLDDMRGLLREGERPGGRVVILHSERDTLADYAKTQDVVELLGDRARLVTLEGTDHVRAADPVGQKLAPDAMNALLVE